MIHTLTMKYYLSFKTAKYLLINIFGMNEKAAAVALYNLCGSNRDKSKLGPLWAAVRAFNASRLGTPIYRFNLKYLQYQRVFVLRFTIDANFLATGRKSIHLFSGSAEMVEKFEQNYHKQMQELFPPLSEKVAGEIGMDEYDLENINYELETLWDFNKGRMHRIDYAFDLHVESELVSLYLSLLKKNRLPNRYYKERNKYKKNCVRYSRSAINVIIYDKLKSVIEQKQTGYISEEEASGVLRLEVQVCRDKARELPGTNIQKLADYYAKAILMEHATNLFPFGNFYNQYYALKFIQYAYPSIKKGKKLVEDSNYTKLKSFLALMQDSQSVVKGYEDFTKGMKPELAGGTRATFNSRIADLEELDIAPYLISKSNYAKYDLLQYKTRENKGLVNPLKQLKNA